MRSTAAAVMALLLSSGLVLAHALEPSQASHQGSETTGADAKDAKHLGIGDKAPPLTIEKWVKGAPVKGFEKGKIYVVEFWATWCPPCRQSIPHLTELQKKFKDVTFIGISSIEKNGLKDVEPFVKDMGDKMDYTVAFDKNRETSQAWMEAAGQNGIPTAFVVTKDQRIAWIGHPMNGMEEVVQQVVDGKYDVEKAAADAKHEAEMQAKLNPIMEKAQEAMQESDFAKAEDLLEQAIAIDPKELGMLCVQKMRVIALGEKDTKKAYAYANQAIGTTIKDNANALDQMARVILTGVNFVEIRDTATAKKAAERANELTKNENPEMLETLAIACSLSGDDERAVDLQTKAVKLATEGPMKEEMQQRLDELSKKVKKS